MKKLLIFVCLIACQGCGHLKDSINIAGGIIVAFGIHEAGHEIAASQVETDLDWKLGKCGQVAAFEYDKEIKNSDIAIINAAGLISQQLSSEFIINHKIKNKFSDGMMLWNTINPISYSIDYFFIHRSNYFKNDKPYGDIASIEYYAGKEYADIFAVGMIGLSALNAWRYLNTENNYQISFSPNSVVFSFNF